MHGCRRGCTVRSPVARSPAAGGRPPGTACGPRKGAAMATTKDPLEERTDAEPELHQARRRGPRGPLGAAQGPPPAAGHGPGSPSPGHRWVAAAGADQRALGGHRRRCLGVARGDRDRGRAPAHQPQRRRSLVPGCPRDQPGGRGGGRLGWLWLRRRWSLAASLLASGLLVASTLACPASGHHPRVGAWWVVQLGCGLGLVATSILGPRRGCTAVGGARSTGGTATVPPAAVGHANPPRPRSGFHPESVPDQQRAVSPLGIAVPAHGPGVWSPARPCLREGGIPVGSRPSRPAFAKDLRRPASRRRIWFL
jgi:hypothetical protein